VFLRFSQQTLISVLRVPKTLYQPLARRHFHRTPYQVLISSFYSHRFLLVFWELILRYVTPLDWYSYFLMVRLYSKHLSILTPHSSNHDLNLETLEGKCNQKWNILYHKTCQLKPTKTWLSEISNFYFRFVDYENQNMITSMNKGWNFQRHVSKHDSYWRII
jgi:hypothetical protein